LKCNSPFRYAGGKFYARNLILPEIPLHSHYCDPFAGRASIFFAKPPVQHSILNDLDQDVINTFCQIRDRVHDLIDLLDGIPATKDLNGFCKNEFQPSNNLERDSDGSTLIVPPTVALCDMKTVTGAMDPNTL